LFRSNGRNSSKRHRQTNSLFTLEEQLHALIRRQKECEKRKRKQIEKVSQHWQKSKCNDIIGRLNYLTFIDRIDNAMIDLDKPDDLDTISKLDFAVDQCNI
jgi:hypothetical protein